jgi:hypothetical protein
MSAGRAQRAADEHLPPEPKGLTGPVQFRLQKLSYEREWDEVTIIGRQHVPSEKRPLVSNLGKCLLKANARFGREKTNVNVKPSAVCGK